jgi:hypothetical protein
MTTTRELVTARNAAGERYSRAIAELIAARGDLAAHDVALANRRSGHGDTVRSFTGVPLQVAHLVHGEFCRDPGSLDWHAVAMAGAEALLKGFES